MCTQGKSEKQEKRQEGQPVCSVRQKHGPETAQEEKAKIGLTHDPGSGNIAAQF